MTWQFWDWPEVEEEPKQEKEEDDGDMPLVPRV